MQSQTSDPTEHAFGVAFRYLARRDRTVAQMQAHLAGRGVGPELLATVLAQLEADGYLDDAAYARRFVEDRRNLDGWGSERITRALLRDGIDRDTVAVAEARDPDEELEAAVQVLRRRWPVAPGNPRDRARALGVLVRRGYALELAHDALRRLEA